jgi:hypothetical protein
MRRLSISNALSLVAIFIALGAGAYAAGLKKNSVKSKQIKDGAVATKDFGDGAVTGPKIADGSIGGEQVADGSLTGADVDEASLSGVSVASAGKAGGLEFREVNFQSGPGFSRPIVDLGGVFSIEALCAGDGLDLNAFTSVANSRISMIATRSGGANDNDTVIDWRASQDGAFNPGEAFQIDNNVPPASGGNGILIQFSTPDGFVATVDVLFAEPGDTCSVTGTAIGG